MGYHLGVDLGTTYVAAALTYGSQPEMVTLGGRSVMIPSVVYLGEDGQRLSGEAAVRRAATEPGRVARTFKRRLGDPIPVRVGGQTVPVTELLAELLRDVVRTVTQQEGEPPERAVLTHPASWGPYRRGVFDEVPALAGLRAGPTVTEPAAAAIHYASTHRRPEGEVVAVYDLGGGTFDVTVLRTRADGCEILGVPEGIERLGGIDFDEALFAHIDHETGGELTALDLREPQAALAVSRVRQDCALAKENLSHDSEALIPVFLPDRNFDIRVTREQFEGLIHAHLESTVGALERTLRSAHLDADEVDAVLLVGGSSRIPLVARMVRDLLGRPTVVDTHPKYAVALGAAILSDTLIDEPVPAAAERPARRPPVAAPPPAEVGDPPTLTLVADGRRIAVPPERPFVIGRCDDAQVALTDSLVSRRHAVVELTDQGWTLTDFSRNGTYLGDERIAEIRVTRPMTLRLGDPADGVRIELVPGAAGPVYALGPPLDVGASVHGRLTAVHSLSTGLLRVGRSADNDVVLDDDLVSRRHAELRRSGHSWQLVDLDSANGTFVNDHRITSAPITPHDVIRVGLSLLQLDGDRLVECLAVAPRRPAGAGRTGGRGWRTIYPPGADDPDA